MWSPGSAFDHLFAGSVDQLTPLEVREVRLHAGKLIRAMPPACFGAERRARLLSFAALLDGDVAPRDFASRPRRIAFPVVMPADARPDAFVDVTVSLGGAGTDEVLRHERLDAAAAAAVRDALAAVRARFPTGKTFVVALPELDVGGASLGLAVALAAVSALTGWPVDERWAVTGRVAAGGQVDRVGHMDRKRALRATERPESRMLGPAEGLLAEEGWTGVASLEEAIAHVFAPDLAAARRDYIEWAERASRSAERRRFAGPGVSPDQLASLELEDVYVEPDLETDEWRRHGAQRERELAQRLEARDLGEDAAEALRAEYRRLTGSEHRAGVTRTVRRPLGAVVESNRLLVICGDAGMGKTTLLQHLERKAIAVAQDAADAPIPVRFSVADFPAEGSTSLGGYALRQLQARWADLPESTTAARSAAVVDHIERGRVVLLVDGLNEAPAAARRAVVDAIDAYIATHSTARMVLTTRRKGYDVPLSGSVEIAHLSLLDARQRRELLTRNASGGRETATVWRFFEENQRLADLGGNPFFLVLGTLLAQADLAGIRHRAQLYEKAFDRLWRDVEEDGIAWRRAVFARVAADQRAEGRASDQAPRLDRRIEAARATLAAASETTAQVRRQALNDAGLLVEEAGGALSFFHPSFQEYLAAVHLTREPIEEVPARLRALRSDPDSGEVVLQALGRLAHVLDEPAEAERALLALSARDEATETIAGSGLLTAWQAIREGVTDDDVVVGLVLVRLAARVREIPDARTSEPFVLAMLVVERTGAVRDELLDELLLLVEAEHPVPWMARHYALQVVAREALREPRAAAACQRAWERFERQDLPAGVVAAMLVDGADLDEAMLALLGRALEQGWLEPTAEALARDGVRHGASLRRLAASATEQDAAVCVTLALLARRDEEMVEAALVRHLEKYDMLAGRGLAYVANRQDRVLARVLARAAESEERARLVAVTVGRGLTRSNVSMHVLPWLLAAPLDCARAWVNAVGEGQAEAAAGSSLHDALRIALAGTPATAARAAVLLTARMPSPDMGDVVERLAAVAPALITRVDGAAAGELLGALFAARLAEPARELLTRLVRTQDVATLESVLRNVSPHDPVVGKIIVGRMTESAVARDHHSVLACARLLTFAQLAQPEVVAALRSVDDGAPLQLQTDAALLLASHGVHEVGVARTLARALAALVDRSGGFRLSRTLGEVVRSGNLRDEETFRLLIDGFMACPDDARFEGGDALRALLQNNDALFEIALNVLTAAADPAQERRARGVVACLLWEWRHANPPDDRLLRRFESRFAGSPMLFHELELVAYGRPSWYEALDRALGDVDRNADAALCAARQLRRVLAAGVGAAMMGAEGERTAAEEGERARRRSRVVAVLRRLLEHDGAHVALEAATELMFLGDLDVQPALCRALAGPPLVCVRAAMGLYALGAEDERVVVALSTCLSSDVETSYYMPELHFAHHRVAHSGPGREGQAILEAQASSPDDDAERSEDDGRAAAEHWQGLAKMIALSPTVSVAAAWLLVALRRREVLPALLDWIEGEDHRKRGEAFAMLEQLGAGREPRVVACQIRQLRHEGWSSGSGISQWLWSNAPEALEHVEALVDVLARERWQREAVRAWLTRCCTARDDWADRVAALAESRPTEVAVELAAVLARAGRVTESVAHRTVVVCCEAEPAALRPLLDDLIGAIDAHHVLAAAWRGRLAVGTPAARVAAARVLWQWEGRAPLALREAIAEAFRDGLDDEDLGVRLEALLGLEHLGLVDDRLVLAARRILDEPDGGVQARVIDGESVEQAEWEVRASTVRRVAAQLLLSWGRQTDAATRWLVGALHLPWPAWELAEMVDALRARGGHDEAVRSSLDAWLRDHAPGTLGERAIIERAQKVGVAAEVLDRRALERLSVASGADEHAVEVLFASERAGDRSGEAFLRRHSRDPSERALYWAQRIAESGIDVARALKLLGPAVGAAPETIAMLLASHSKRLDGSVLAAVAELVRRRAADGFQEELGRAFLLRWVGSRMSPV